MILWHEDPRSGRRVVAACGECRRMGIRHRMPLHEAIALAGREAKPSLPLRVEPHCPQADRRALMRLADEVLLHISPLTALEPEPQGGAWAGVERRECEMLLVEITGIGDWFGGEPAVLFAVQELSARHGYAAQTAIADTAAAAWGLVRFGGEASIAVPPGETPEAVNRLPPEALRLPVETAHQLERLGIDTIGRLRQLPRGGLASRLGGELMVQLDRMLGTAEESPAMHNCVPEDSATCELEYPTTDRDILGHRIGKLIETLAAGLAARVRGALRFSCRLELMEGRCCRPVEVGLFAPTADAEHLRRLMLTALENRQLPAMVRRVSVTIDHSAPLRQFQPTLFDESEAAGRGTLARLVENVAMRLGNEAVLAAVPRQHPVPELACRTVPLAGRAEPSPGRAKGKGAGGRSRDSGLRASEIDLGPLKSPRRSILPPSPGPSASDPLRRPIGLFSPPLPINVTLSPRDGAVTHICLSQSSRAAGHAGRQRVLDCRGPERIETTRRETSGHGESAAAVIRRDYYRIETEGGVRLWIFRDRTADREAWYLHGSFD